MQPEKTNGELRLPDEPLEAEWTQPEEPEVPKSRRLRQSAVDIPYAILVVILSVIGLVMLFSASYASSLQDMGDASYQFVRQGIFLLIGMVVMVIISRFRYQYWRALSIPLMAVSLALLVLVPFFGVKRNFATRWFDLGITTIQPSEIAKLAVIVCFAAMISGYRERMKTFRWGVLPFAGILVAIAGLLFLEPHLSAIVLILGVGVSLMFAGGTRVGWFVLLLIAAVAAGYFAVIELGYAQDRIALWQDPTIDPLDKGYQAIQSLYAIGSGGLFGLGLGQSRQKLLYLPEEHNDFIFSIVCEELGLVGAVTILALFIFLILRGYWIAARARDRFGSLLVSGISTLLALQTALNVAVVTNLIPVTGISMPFFSSGGSALIMQLAEMGIVLAVSRQLAASPGDGLSAGSDRGDGVGGLRVAGSGNGSSLGLGDGVGLGVGLDLGDGDDDSVGGQRAADTGSGNDDSVGKKRARGRKTKKRKSES
ncbi:MAG: putative lipid II flippase FtsW [Oscillospiraceae bacterium]|nr:putative lipid II flippase FtsW [Oscillospiraceae bacterium]